MKKFTKISLIIAAVLAGAGMLLCGISSVMGAGYGTLRQMARNGELNRGNWHIDEHGVYYRSDEEITVEIDEDFETEGIPGTESNESTSYVAEAETHREGTHRVDGTSYVYDIAEIVNLDIDVNAASILFTEGENSDVIVVTLRNCNEKYYEAEMEGDTLQIKYDTEHYVHENNNNMKITIAIPAGMNFDEIDMDMGATNAEFELTDVTCNTLNMDIGAGNVIADEFRVKELLKVTVGAGNVEISGGSYKNIKIDCGMGNFSMKGKLEGDIEADCGMGSMDLRLEGDADAYNYALSCGMGELEVNGTKYSSIAGDNKVTNPGAVGTIDLDCGMGSIELEIE